MDGLDWQACSGLFPSAVGHAALPLCAVCAECDQVHPAIFDELAHMLLAL